MSQVSALPPVYRIGRLLVRIELTLLHRILVEDADRVPSEGGVVVVANHASFLDIPIVSTALRRHVAFVARDTLARSRFLGFVMRGSRAILIRRGSADRAALRAIVERLRSGDCVAMFPEGARTRDGSLGDFRAGAFVAARQAGVPVVPAGIRGSGQALPRDAALPRFRRVGIRFGEPIDPKAPDAVDAARRAVAEMIGDGTFAGVPALPKSRLPKNRPPKDRVQETRLPNTR